MRRSSGFKIAAMRIPGAGYRYILKIGVGAWAWAAARRGGWVWQDDDVTVRYK